MRRISILLTALTLSMAVFGAMAVKSNEAKRTTTDIAYISLSSGIVQLKADQSIFDDAMITNNAILRTNNGTYVQLYKNSNLTGALKVIP